MVLGKLDNHTQNNENTLSPYKNRNQKGIEDLNVRFETMKLLENI